VNDVVFEFHELFSHQSRVHGLVKLGFVLATAKCDVARQPVRTGGQTRWSHAQNRIHVQRKARTSNACCHVSPKCIGGVDEPKASWVDALGLYQRVLGWPHVNGIVADEYVSFFGTVFQDER
jgi:hypothetical protein